MITTKQLQVIGKNELIDFPNQGIFQVPAKIDTGADSCAVWASNVEESNGTLKFSLFAPGSALYNGEIITTNDYKTTPVKNSFGEKEVRFNVKLSIKLQNRQFKIRFTLADRSRNHFPVLLGKNFLRNKFLVDVSRSYLHSSSIGTLQGSVLAISARTDDEVRVFYENVQNQMPTGLKLDLVNYSELVFWLGGQPKITLLPDGRDITEDTRLIYFRNHTSNSEQAAAVAHYAQYRNVNFRDEELLSPVATSKLSELMKLSCFGLPVPKGVAMVTPLFIKHVDIVIERIGLPLVLKDVYSDRSKNNYYIQTKSQLLEILNNSSNNCYFLAQKYIPNDGFTRVLVLGKKAPLGVVRRAVKNDDPLRMHLNNPSGGSNASLVEHDYISGEVASLAIRAGEVMQRQVAGVDLIRDKKTDEWYILEVNNSPAMLAGSFVEAKTRVFADYLKSEVERW